MFFVLLLSLRHMGISEEEISAAKVLAVFSFRRLLSAVPMTPGGLGVIELGYVGGLVGPGEQKAAAVAAVLIFRTAHVRDPDPARRVDVLDLAGEEELAPSAARGERASGLGGRFRLIHLAIEHQRRDLVHHRERDERDPRSEQHAGDHVSEPVCMEVDP